MKDIDLNTDLGRRWVAMTLNLLSTEASETNTTYWLRISGGKVAVGNNPDFPKTDEHVQISPQMSTSELLAAATTLGTLIAKPLTVTPILVLSEEEIILLKAGHKINSIKALRARIKAETGVYIGLKEAKDAVDAYCGAHDKPGFFFDATTVNEPHIKSVLDKYLY